MELVREWPEREGTFPPRSWALTTEGASIAPHWCGRTSAYLESDLPLISWETLRKVSGYPGLCHDGEKAVWQLNGACVSTSRITALILIRELGAPHPNSANQAQGQAPRSHHQLLLDGPTKTSLPKGKHGFSLAGGLIT